MPFEKHYLLKALDESIERQEKEIKRVQDNVEKMREALIEPEAIIDIHEHVKRDFQVVRKRTEDTPQCKEI